ncbi:MAG: NUDIX hydrolase [Alphaproteobacteria bacterium]|nr:NUDIX hydrolase [Alphaproteobacteria bacterium]MBM3654555.1 NUDIX hydrolase [Alphaproteobacteria bacterium]
MKTPKPKKKREGVVSAPRTQYAALPWRLANGRVEVMLVTSRDTRRWIIPKGWPMKGRKPHIVAAIEAVQEAGLLGKIDKMKLGDFFYEKRLASGSTVDCRVEVFSLRVQKQQKKWAEKKQRATRWFECSIAADLVEEPELRDLILGFCGAPSQHKA